jgi:hypothetical protein
MKAAEPSKNFFMSVPRYCRCEHQSNNEAAIWLLRGDAQGVML